MICPHCNKETVSHGTTSRHKMGCRCELCRDAKAKYDAERYAKKKAKAQRRVIK